MGVYLAAHPHDASVELEHASLLVDAGKDDDALAELDKAATAGPESLRALKLRALIYFHKKQYDNAVPVLVKAIALAPQDAELRRNWDMFICRKKTTRTRCRCWWRH